MPTTTIESKPAVVVPKAKLTGCGWTARSAPPAVLVLEDGTRFEGRSFGRAESVAGEVVFTTGMVGYPETMTDPSFAGQIVVSTYPLVGNYGVPAEREEAGCAGLSAVFESWKIHAAGIVVSEYSERYSHWDAARSLHEWLAEQGIPGITGIDTRSLTQHLRERGTMLGRITVSGRDVPPYDPNKEDLGRLVTTDRVRVYKPFPGVTPSGRRVCLIDCGAKYNIIRSFLRRGVEVVRVPYDADISQEKFDGLMVSNGPGDPTMYEKAIEQVRGAIGRGVPTFGICLGHQLLALAIGAKTYKLKYGHRSQNQPCIEVGTNRCVLTSQNHGFAVDHDSLPREWRPWFTNLNDGTSEGLRHNWGPFRSVQFHPEATPGPTDTAYLFDEFIAMLR
ncbi:MAG: glutamine-hydrolyzing carbamoyl-phosphate synthase small subunit [Phycisphaerales bacterium]